MCLHVSVAILSGQSVFVEMESGSSVEDLRKAAESQLQTSLGILVQPGGAEFLRGTSTLQDAGIQDGDVVGAFMAKPKLQLHANRLSHAICAIQKDGSVIAWGDEDSGGDSSDVQDELVNVWDVKMTARACAALRRDGTVVSWGCEDLGGDSDAVQEDLQNIQQVFSTAGAFAAIRADGAVIAWGDEDWGGDCTEVQEDLKNVIHICGSGAAFAALTAHGSVITWGSACHGGDSRNVSAQLQDVQSICATSAAFAAITGSGDVLVWGIHCSVAMPAKSQQSWLAFEASRRLPVHLRQSSPTAVSFAGVCQSLVDLQRILPVGFSMLKQSSLPAVHSQQSRKKAKLSAGEIQNAAVTLPQCASSS